MKTLGPKTHTKIIITILIPEIPSLLHWEAVKDRDKVSFVNLFSALSTRLNSEKPFPQYEMSD